jgi:hypothetical protein
MMKEQSEFENGERDQMATGRMGPAAPFYYSAHIDSGIVRNIRSVQEQRKLASKQWSCSRIKHVF